MDIVKAASRVAELSASFTVRIGGLEKLVQERETKELADASRYAGASAEHDSEVRRVVNQVARNQAKRAAGEYRRTLLAQSDAERAERLKAIMEIDALAVQLSPLYERPQQLLGRQGLGSAERSRYHEQLRDAGPAELVSMRDWALHTNDRALGAAIMSRLDAMSTKTRPFDAADFAMKLVGDEFDATRKAIATIRVATQRALNANRDFERGSVDATAKIGMGLAQRRIA